MTNSRKINTRFGEVEYDPEQTVHFPEGLIGLEGLHNFIVMPNKKEGPLLSKALAMYETRLKAVSFLPLKDHKYVQAPYEEITRKKYLAMSKKLKRPKLNFEVEEVEKFCDGDVCEL